MSMVPSALPSALDASGPMGKCYLLPGPPKGFQGPAASLRTRAVLAVAVFAFLEIV